MTLPRNVGVGTSAYLAATAMFWIGRMILFGLGALIAAPPYEQKM
jgi:hypothetical protein